MSIEDSIDQFLDSLSFDTLIVWADILGVEHDEDCWLDDEWPDKASELQTEVAEAMEQVGKSTKLGGQRENSTDAGGTGS